MRRAFLALAMVGTLLCGGKAAMAAGPYLVSPYTTYSPYGGYSYSGYPYGSFGVYPRVNGGYYASYGGYQPTGIWWLNRPSYGAYLPPTYGGSAGAVGTGTGITYGYRYNNPGDPSSGFAPGGAAVQYYFGQ